MGCSGLILWSESPINLWQRVEAEVGGSGGPWGLGLLVWADGRWRCWWHSPCLLRLGFSPLPHAPHHCPHPLPAPAACTPQVSGGRWVALLAAFHFNLRRAVIVLRKMGALMHFLIRPLYLLSQVGCWALPS